MFQYGSWKRTRDWGGAGIKRTLPALAVVPAHNEAGTIRDVVRELRSLPEIQRVIVVANGSTDGTAEIARQAGATVLHYPERVGYDVARALAIKAFPASAYLFVDGDIVIPARDLRPFIEAIGSGIDVALNDLEHCLSDAAKLHPVNIAKRFLNIALGRPDLGCNSLTAVPHALSEKAIKVLGYQTVAVPPVAHALAIRQGLVVKGVSSVDVISTNRIHPGSSMLNYLTGVIVGDHLEALSYMLDNYGRRAGFPDGFRCRDLVLPVPEILEPVESLSRSQDDAAVGGEGPKTTYEPVETPSEGSMSQPAREESALDFNRGFDQGYDRGFDAGADLAWEVGFQDCIATLVPDRVPLPLGYSLDRIIARGVEALQSEEPQPIVLSIWDAFTEVKRALSKGSGFSVVRVGDREIRFLAHGLTRSFEASFMSSAGVERPEAADQAMLAKAIHQADLLGLPICHQFEYQSLFFETMPSYGLKPYDFKCTDANFIYIWYARGYLRNLLLTGARPPRVLLVGNGAPALEPVLRREGVAVTGTISPVDGLHSVHEVLGRIASQTFDLALVAAGTAAVVICPAIAREMGKVAIDIGDLADHLARGIRRL